MKFEMKLNDKHTMGSSQFKREILKGMEREVENTIRKAARGLVRVRKTRGGFVIEGEPEQIEQFQRRLK